MNNNEEVLKKNWGNCQLKFPMLDFITDNPISIQMAILTVATNFDIEFAPNNNVNRSEIDRAIQIYLNNYYNERSNFKNYSQVVTDRDRQRAVRLAEIMKDTDFKVSHFTYGNVSVFNMQITKEVSILVSPVQLVIRQASGGKYFLSKYVRKTATDSLRPYLPLVKSLSDNNIITPKQYQEILRILVPIVDLRKPVTKRGSN